MRILYQCQNKSLLRLLGPPPPPPRRDAFASASLLLRARVARPESSGLVTLQRTTLSRPSS
eukprot:1178273-Rhodomonas_salina.2